MTTAELLESQVKFYEHIPVIVEAIRYDGDNYKEINTFLQSNSGGMVSCYLSNGMLITTEGIHLYADDWLVKTVDRNEVINWSSYTDEQFHFHFKERNQ